MTTFYLIRHGETDAGGAELTGRRPGVRLSERGRAQAAWVAEALAGARLAAVCSSPRERALETAAPVAAGHGLEVGVEAALDEVDFGEWSGRAFDELALDGRWRLFNAFRGGTRPPGGELLVEVAARAVSALDRVRRARPGDAVAVVSHADVLRCAVAHFIGVPLDVALRLEIDVGSITTLVVEDWGARLVGLNAGRGATGRS